MNANIEELGVRMHANGMNLWHPLGEAVFTDANAVDLCLMGRGRGGKEHRKKQIKMFWSVKNEIR